MRVIQRSLKSKFESPFAAIEKQLKINIKDDLLPLLGSEIALALPMQGMGMVGIPGVVMSAPEAKESGGVRLYWLLQYETRNACAPCCRS